MTSTSDHPQVIFIGIAGPSGCGKTTYTVHLIDHLHSPLYPIVLDHFFIRPIPINHPILGRTLSDEEPETLFIEGLLTLLRQIKHEPEKITRYHRKDVSIKDKKYIFVIVEGFLLFALSDEITNMFDVRIFFESTLSQCRMRRYRRQNKIEETIPDEQVIITNGFQQWFDHLVWDGYLKRRDLQISKAEKVFQSDEYQNRQYIQLDNYIDKRLKDIIDQNK
jgi:uridine kinase